MMKLIKNALGLLALVSALGMASPASALTTQVTVTGTSITVDCIDNVVPISDPVCGGIVGGSLTKVGNEVVGGTAGTTDTTSPINADLYDIGANNVGNEAKALNVLTGTTSYTSVDGAKTDAGGVSSLSFDSTAAHIAFKIGAGHFFLSLLSPGTINIAFDRNDQSAGGFSHYTEFGVSPIPVPAAVWLFGTALIGFIGMSRRTKV